MAEKLLHEMVLDASVRYSCKIAVTFDSGTSANSLTYKQLVTLGDELTKCLQDIVPKDLAIGLYCQSNLHLPVWILGILRLPAAYAPLDPDSPAIHTLRVIRKCYLKFCLIQNDLLERFKTAFSGHLGIDECATWTQYRLTLIRIQGDLSPPQSTVGALQSGQKCNNLLLHASVTESSHQREQLAYVLHTSGTTGFPKIVRVPHKCIAPNIVHLRSLFDMKVDDVVFLASPLTFDPSVVEMFLCLSSGAQLLMVPSAIKKMPNRLAQMLFTRHRTSVLQATPTLLRRFGRRVLQGAVLCADSSLRVLALGGEACPSLAVLRSWRQPRNRTRIYNLYGTTEVSCWACCHPIPQSLLQQGNMEDCPVPLGQPLLGTDVEVRDELGCQVTEGEGQVFLGGQERVCLLDDEERVAMGTLRATGDWVSVQDGQLFYLGRRDGRVKRHGQLLHLQAVQQVLESVCEAEACAVGLHENGMLLAFVVPSSSHSSSSSQSCHGDCTDQGDAVGSTERRILQRLSKLLPSHSIPDAILLVPSLPFTSHGKVALGELMHLYDRQSESSASHAVWTDLATLQDRLQALWRDALGLAEDALVDLDGHFLLSGGDSLQAIRLCGDITAAIGVPSDGLLEVILDSTFAEVLNHVAMMARLPEQGGVLHKSAKRQREDSPYVAAKKQATGPALRTEADRTVGTVVPSERGLGGFVVIRRAGDVVEMLSVQSSEEGVTRVWAATSKTKSDLPTQNTVATPTGDTSASPIQDTSAPPRGDMSAPPSNSTAMDGPSLKLRVLWSSDTGRCVDASGVLLVERGKAQETQATVFIGSHSHRMQALDLTNGMVRWERILGDRLESSAAISKCGTMVIVGCYDGQVYFLCVTTGETRWVFQTGEAVKSTPTVDPQSGLVLLGSHDGHTYALSAQERRCVWKHHCGGGAVFSSPCVHAPLRQLYTATLSGRMLCLCPDTGALLWTHVSGAPFFSSPSCCAGCVCIGSVDGSILGLSHAGQKLWQCLTNGPVFSSPCMSDSSPTNQLVICGSHDGSVYCLSCADGTLLWSHQTTGKVYSSPFMFDGSPWGCGMLVAVCSTDGTVWVLEGESGIPKASLHLPGELFSSPIIWGRTLVVGCRNDFVYGIELSTLGELQTHVSEQAV